MQLPYVIFEMANAHDGSRDKLFQLIEEYTRIDYPRKAIKFQPLKPDLLALPDYAWFKTHQELYFEADIWREAIAMASEVGEVWIDVFDTYGVDLIADHRSRIAGIKLQASVLDNVEIVAALTQIGVAKQRLLINVSGHEISAIEQYVQHFGQLGPAELILQIGFQDYPTAISETGLQKIPVLRAAFPNIPLCIADHAPGETTTARQIPAWATVAGCSYVEKHFCLSRSETKHDRYSALEPQEFREMLARVADVVAASCGPFISAREGNYLRKSYQSPIVREELPAGRLIGISDMYFRRTSQTGLTWSEIVNEQGRRSILDKTIPKNSPISRSEFRKARIGVIVACRLKSSRLKMKAIAPIHGVPSVERCLHNCLLIPNVDHVVLATSTVQEDQLLEQHTLGGRAQFFAGEADDVIDRYLSACDRYGIDVIVRVTADCPALSPEIASLLLDSHFAAGADYTAPKECAIGSSPEIFNVEALRRVIASLGKAEYSEYMTWYMENNADVFKLNLVDLPAELRRDYRLTLDYPEDLEMFNRLYSVLDGKSLEATLMNVFSVLDADPSIPSLNRHLTLSYKTDTELIDRLNRETRIPVSPMPSARR